MRKFWCGFYLYPPEAGAGSGSGSSENGGASGNDTSVTSGSASESLIAAALASESSSGGTPAESEAATVAKIAGVDVQIGETLKPGAQAGAAKPDATGQPGAVETGPVPRDRHIAAVQNARAAGATEATAKFAWAKDLDQSTVQTAFDLTRSLLSDTPRFLRTLAAQEGYQLIPVGDKPGVEKPAERKPFTLPKADLRSEDGKGAFSEEQMSTILKEFAADLEAKFGGQLKPILTAKEEADKQAAQNASREEIRQTVTETMTELRTKPFFQVQDKDGNKVDSPKIMEYLLAIPEKVRVANPIAAIHRAYATYMEKDILPNYGKISEQRVRDENAKKAAASGGVRPGAGGGQGDTTPKPIRGVNDLAARMEQMYAAAESGSGA